MGLANVFCCWTNTSGDTSVFCHIYSPPNIRYAHPLPLISSLNPPHIEQFTAVARIPYDQLSRFLFVCSATWHLKVCFVPSCNYLTIMQPIKALSGSSVIKNHLNILFSSVIIGCHCIWMCCQLITCRVVPKWALCLYKISGYCSVWKWSRRHTLVSKNGIYTVCSYTKYLLPLTSASFPSFYC